MKVLIVRNDKLGDFMLTFPAFALLKKSLPDCEVHALVQPYTEPMARLCPWIDNIKLDRFKSLDFRNVVELARNLRAENYDAVITLYSDLHIALAVALARIPYRLAPATKLAQIFYTQRLRQKRSRSEKPEYVYNRDLVEKYLTDSGKNVTNYPEPPYLALDTESLIQLRARLCKENNIAAKKTKLVFIHPGSGGSANNLSLSQYAELTHALDYSESWQLIISAGPGEEKQARQLAKLTKSVEPVIYISQAGLNSFTHHLAIADLFISGSTGPLHIAGALNVATAAFYTRRRSATSLRWQTLNTADKRLAFCPPDDAEEFDMSSIDLNNAALKISERYLT